MIRNVPDELHKQLRLVALQRGVSMNALLIELIKAVVRKGE
jgi:plasmid stability protein